uniref:Ricin B-related lectin n=1 Tax=Cerioporus squamosus TaxID=2829415 RepID=Q75WT9_9APHY|nr:Chain A, Ricin B-related lectin [Cerioporus squamosus]3PHZ_B Chain B, Ricin B-related lectin [Cerioporus squamosus]5MUA_A Chain A, Ricin B-related lectin [Cerioporus squamosus]5MUA_B Chain B, Ricin B-related lectin [Cerioporus squamosus]BAC87875.1 Ricin B-related lectin [Cerioporus squamosus]
MSFQGHGIYYIASAYVANTRLALSEDSSANKSPDVIISSDAVDPLNNLWLIEPVGEADTYTVRNAFAGSYMDLAGHAATDGTAIIGYRPTGGDNQKWIISQINDVWKIKSKETGTFVTLLNGDGGGTGTVVGWQNITNNTSQNWTFQKLSQTGANVHATLLACPALRQDFKSYLSDGLYLVLTRDQISSIWQASGLGSTPWRSEIFDCDDFATVFKGAVAKWGNENFKANGFALLCGLMFGSKSSGAHAYNWFVERGNFSTVTFFEPQNGTYSANAWDYKAYFGLF